jgi:hypothetical protein
MKLGSYCKFRFAFARFRLQFFFPMQDSLTSQREPCLPIHLPFQQFEPLYLSFSWSIPPCQGQSGFHSLILLSQTLSKGTQFSTPMFLHL